MKDRVRPAQKWNKWFKLAVPVFDKIDETYFSCLFLSDHNQRV